MKRCVGSKEAGIFTVYSRKRSDPAKIVFIVDYEVAERDGVCPIRKKGDVVLTRRFICEHEIDLLDEMFGRNQEKECEYKRFSETVYICTCKEAGFDECPYLDNPKIKCGVLF